MEINNMEDYKEKIIARLKEIHADFVRQSQPGKSWQANYDEERAYENCADEIEKFIKEIEK